MRLRAALIASVIVNLFLAGMLAGGAARLRHGRGMVAAGALRIAGSELPAGERRGFRRALRDTRLAMAPAIERSRAARLRAAALLREQTLNERGVLDALQQARSADSAVRGAVETRAVAYAATLPPPDRARLADAMQLRVRHPRD